MFAEPNTQTKKTSFLPAHSHPGRLITAEGLDGSGKSTQLQLLSFWLKAEGYEVVTIEWTPSHLIKRALKKGKKQGLVDPLVLSVLYAADMAELYDRDILPPLQRGAIVLADRYVYTALARDMAHGVARDWVECIYQFAVRPDLAVYFHLSAETSVARTLSGHPHLKYYQAGMDMGLSDDPVASFQAFQQRILTAYEALRSDCAMLTLDATMPIKYIQRSLRTTIEQLLPQDG